MSRSEEAIIREKLLLLDQYLRELGTVKDISFVAYQKSPMTRRGVERLLQLLVEVASDVNGLLLSRRGALPPDSYYRSFIAAGESGVIPKPLARALAPSAGLRNRIVHEYGEYKDSLVHPNIARMHRLYGQYLKLVERAIRLPEKKK